MAKKKSSNSQGGSKAKNAAKGKEKKVNRPDGDFEKLLEEVDKPKSTSSSKKKAEVNVPEKKISDKANTKKEAKQAALESKSKDAEKKVDVDDDDESDGNFSFVSMFIAIIAFVLAVKILLNYNDLNSRNKVLQDRLESIDEALDRSTSEFDKKLEAFGKTLVKEKKPEVKKKVKVDKYAKRFADYERKNLEFSKKLLNHQAQVNVLEKIVFSSNNFQAALELKSALDRLDDLGKWVTGDSKKKVDAVRSNIIDLITSLEHGSDSWKPNLFKQSKQRFPGKPSAEYGRRKSIKKSFNKARKAHGATPHTHTARQGTAHKHATPVPVRIKPNTKRKTIKKSFRAVPFGKSTRGAVPVGRFNKSRLVPGNKHKGVKPKTSHDVTRPKTSHVAVKPKTSVKKAAPLGGLLSAKDKGKDDSFESLFEGFEKEDSKAGDDILDF